MNTVKAHKVVVSNVDDNGYFEVIIYDKNDEKIAEFLTLQFVTELYSSFEDEDCS
jgi:hypothetical protein